MTRLIFPHTFRPKGSADNIPTYEAGKVYEFVGAVAETYATKYKRLGIAIDAPADEPKAAAPAPRPAADPAPAPPAAPDPAPASVAAPVLQPTRTGRGQR